MTHKPDRTVRLGTRGSQLALRQAELTADRLRKAIDQVDVELVVIKTEADAAPERPISHFGDKGVFVRGIEQALLDDRIDLAVHSLKDVPADIEHPALFLAAYLPREDARDALVSRTGLTLNALPAHAVVGTSSLRRRVQLRTVRPDCRTVPVRGNVDTRLRKLVAREFDALILAAAGLHRLGLKGRIAEYLPESAFVPDAGQGIIAVQARRDDAFADLAGIIDDVESHVAAVAERATVRAMHADCRSPVGVHATFHGSGLRIAGMASTEDGSRVVRHQVEGDHTRAAELGMELGEALVARLSK